MQTANAPTVQRRMCVWRIKSRHRVMYALAHDQLEAFEIGQAAFGPTAPVQTIWLRARQHQEASMPSTTDIVHPSLLALRETAQLNADMPTDSVAMHVAPFPTNNFDLLDEMTEYTSKAKDEIQGLQRALDDADQAGYVRGHNDGIRSLTPGNAEWFAGGLVAGILLAMLTIGAFPDLVRDHPAPNLLSGNYPAASR